MSYPTKHKLHGHTDDDVGPCRRPRLIHQDGVRSSKHEEVTKLLSSMEATNKFSETQGGHFNNKSAAMALREFDILDEFDHDDDDQESDNPSDKSFDSDVPDEEIEAMLEEGLPEEFKRRRKHVAGWKEGETESPYEEREKIVLEDYGAAEGCIVQQT